MDIEAIIDQRRFKVSYSVKGDDVEVLLDGRPYLVNVQLQPGGFLSMLINGKSHNVFLKKDTDHYDIVIHGTQYSVELVDPRQARPFLGHETKSTGNKKEIYAPMTGQVRRVLVSIGQKVKEGEGLVILEAMKMENEIKSRTSGVVSRVEIQVGDIVFPGQVLVAVK